MRYLSIVVLVVIFSSACRDYKCTQSFSENFNLSVLPIWERKTQINMVNQNDDKLVKILKYEREDKVSIFERQAFLNSLSKEEQLNDYKFNSLIIVELNSSGERYKSIKYLLLSCDSETTVIKYELNQGKWELIKTHLIKTGEIDSAINVLTNRSDNTIYWGYNITDLVAVTKFRERNEITVEVFGSLSKKQNEALKVMEK
ncbi:hypothetical protein SAMN05421820_101381 [Pedobacter steynii]|uniref:Uncharacterized protein n=1 Tax=Pedobacter steynii TaxID=430522 RepID=A0A1G9JUS6_9SPHI|nr:hypothetical protein [Pedobacter steynii]NQX38364.1 hypothetical protein [Pedobacter steynii]SDL41297.1 hypothetical protein SAMN05421820_101381 [Pedobacter steynii]